MPHLPEGSFRLCARSLIEQVSIERFDQSLDVFCWDDCSKSMGCNLVGKVVAFRYHHRKRRPQVIQDSGSE